jgi:hypothetical protein
METLSERFRVYAITNQPRNANNFIGVQQTDKTFITRLQVMINLSIADFQLHSATPPSIGVMLNGIRCFVPIAGYRIFGFSIREQNQIALRFSQLRLKAN